MEELTTMIVLVLMKELSREKMVVNVKLILLYTVSCSVAH